MPQKTRTEWEPKALRQIRKPLKTKTSRPKPARLCNALGEGFQASVPNPPRGKLWEKITRTARVSRRNPKALFFGSNAWAKLRFS
jgi:hypothetical protein